MSWQLTTILDILKVGRQRTCQILTDPALQLLIMEYRKSNAAMNLIVDKFKLRYITEYVNLINRCPIEEQKNYLQIIFNLLPESLQSENMNSLMFLIETYNCHNENLIETNNTFEHNKTIALMKLKAKDIELDNQIEAIAEKA
ncbi:MAG: hypothetical protein J6Z01_06210 [Bacteroidales bacterium]|nr:hypothetical protein [Bacteroidales bacterium]